MIDGRSPGSSQVGTSQRRRDSGLRGFVPQGARSVRSPLLATLPFSGKRNTSKPAIRAQLTEFFRGISRACL